MTTKLEQAARPSQQAVAAMQLALEALDEAISYTSCESWSPSMTDDCNKAITALREALASRCQTTTTEQVEQEPVAWRAKRPDGKWGYGDAPIPVLPFDTPHKLYAAPVEPVKQEPVAEVFVRPLRGDQSQPTTDIKWLQRPTAGKLYAAPVRTKDLTDDELMNVWVHTIGKHPIMQFARAVIAADRAKNNLCERTK